LKLPDQTEDKSTRKNKKRKRKRKRKRKPEKDQSQDDCEKEVHCTNSIPRASAQESGGQKAEAVLK
jgi:hypothetical protein